MTLTRRQFLAGAAALTAVGCSTPAPPPNILLIIADDFGIDACPGYPIGDRKPTMPVLEGLARTGLTFDNVWVAQECTPTRAAIITGKYGFRTGVGSVGDAIQSNERILHRLLAERTRYATALIGKWHLAPRGLTRSHPNEMGVPYYAGVLEGQLPDYLRWPLVINGSATTETRYATTVFTDLAIDWIKNQQSPWFLWLAHTAPHAPFHLPPTSLHNRTDLSGQQADIRRRPLEYYFAAAEALDTEIGRLLGSLSSEARANTTVIVIGDNGTPPRLIQGYAPAQGKGTISEGGIHVPLFVAGAGVTRRGEREAALVHGVDLHATIADFAGSGLTTVHDGQSIRPLLTSPGTGRRETVYSEVFSHGGAPPGRPEDDDLALRAAWAIRDPQHKFIRYADGRDELYDLLADPPEQRDLLREPDQPALAIASRLAEIGTLLRQS